MTGPIDLIIAATAPHPALAANLARFVAEAGTIGRVVLAAPAGARIEAPDPSIRPVRSARGRLAPELWRDGLIASSAPLVAFSTSQMAPEAGWLSRLADALGESGAAGVGGPVAAAPGLSATDRAVALLRYSGYFPPLPDPEKVSPPGENALYRRDRLDEVESSWLDGFWEVEVQRALIARGHRLAMSRSAVVAFGGGARLPAMAGQRFAHARRYGRFRSAGSGIGPRLRRAASAPLVPAVLAARIAGNLRARDLPMSPWLSALPALAILAPAWALGEAWGVLEGSDGRGPIMATSKDRVAPPDVRARRRARVLP